MGTQKDLLLLLRKKKEKADQEFEAVVKLKDPILIGSVMDRLNKLEQEIMLEEYRQEEWKKVMAHGIYNKNHPDWSSPMNNYARLLAERMQEVFKELRYEEASTPS